MNEKDWRNYFDGSVAQGRSDRWHGSYDGLIFKDMGHVFLSFFFSFWHASPRHLNFCHFALSLGFTHSTAGAGPETVKKWYAKGFRTLDDLQRAKLTHQQQTGLKYYNVRSFLLFSFEPRSFMYCVIDTQWVVSHSNRTFNNVFRETKFKSWSTTSNRPPDPFRPILK